MTVQFPPYFPATWTTVYPRCHAAAARACRVQGEVRGAAQACTGHSRRGVEHWSAFERRGRARAVTRGCCNGAAGCAGAPSDGLRASAPRRRQRRGAHDRAGRARGALAAQGARAAYPVPSSPRAVARGGGSGGGRARRGPALGVVWDSPHRGPRAGPRPGGRGWVSPGRGGARAAPRQARGQPPGTWRGNGCGSPRRRGRGPPAHAPGQGRPRVRRGGGCGRCGGSERVSE